MKDNLEGREPMSTTLELDHSLFGRIRRIVWAFLSGDGRQISHYAKRLGLNPDIAYPIARVMRFVGDPLPFVTRRLATKMIRRTKALDNVFDQKTGWGVVPMRLPGFDAMANTIRRLKDERASGMKDDYYIKMVFGDEDLDAHPEVRDFVLSDEMLQLASDYLGAVPVLRIVQGWYTPVNDGLASSQLFHRDGIDYRQAKFVINIKDMKREDGPFEFLPADVSDRVTKNLATWRGRMTDEKIFESCSPNDVVSTAGPVGSAFAVDGCRCYHYGGRSRGGERLVLLVQFGSYYSSMSAARGITPDVNWYSGDKLRQLALGLK
jgi:hypothetical protein